jgi:hypothetical protein
MASKRIAKDLIAIDIGVFCRNEVIAFTRFQVIDALIHLDGFRNFFRIA